MKNVLALMATAWMPALLLAQSCEELPTDSIFACYGDTIVITTPPEYPATAWNNELISDSLTVTLSQTFSALHGQGFYRQHGQAAYFDGPNGDACQLLSHSDASLWMEADFSLGLWFRSSGVAPTTNVNRIVSRDRSDYFYFGIDQSSNFPQDLVFDFAIEEGDSYDDDPRVPDAVTGEWQYLAMTFEGENQQAKIFLDGELISVQQASFNDTERPLALASNVELAVEPMPGYGMRGDVDGVTLWDIALTLEEHNAIMACGYEAIEQVPFAAWTFEGISNGMFEDEVSSYDATNIGGQIVQGPTDSFCFECQATQQVVVEFSLESEVGCTDIEACNYEDDNVCEDGSCTYPSEDYLDCAGECLNDVNANGVCDELDVYGCDVLGACNYDASVTVYDGSCFYATAVYDCQGNCQSDADEDGICDQNEGASVGNGPDFCGDNTIWDPVAQRCIANGPVLCGENTVWDPISQACVGAQTCPTDLDGSGLIGLGDLLDLLSNYGTICD